MLVSLHIENVASIKEIDIDFEPGFTALTGETGAGKSIIIDSINLLLGEKSNRSLIRSGESSASVQALFSGISEDKIEYISSLGVPCDGELLLYREIYDNGRSVVKCCGRSMPLYMLRDITGRLLSIHGQNASQALMNEENHLRYLDAYAEDAELLNDFTAQYAILQKLNSEIKALTIDDKQKARTVEEYKRQLDEIKSAKLKPGEEDELLAAKTRIKNYENTSKYIKIVYHSLYHSEKLPSATERIDRAIEALNALNESEKSEKLASQIKTLTDYRYEIEDIALSVKELSADIGEDPSSALDRIEDRLQLITRLKRKYGSDILQINAYADELNRKLADISTSEDRRLELIKEGKGVLKLASEAAIKLSAVRKEAAKRLSEAVVSEFIYFDLKKAKFLVDVDSSDRLTGTGIDTVSFRIATNTGEEPKPMQTIASGGELSRIMLALKSVFAEKDELDTVIYDEVDTGISGATSERIGNRLRQTARGCQVIAITHSAQIAARADNQILIYKEDSEGRTHTRCLALDKEQRVTEIARILGGIDITQNVLAAAREMIYNNGEENNGST